jgi:hypothetical protein
MIDEIRNPAIAPFAMRTGSVSKAKITKSEPTITPVNEIIITDFIF